MFGQFFGRTYFGDSYFGPAAAAGDATAAGSVITVTLSVIAGAASGASGQVAAGPRREHLFVQDAFAPGDIITIRTAMIGGDAVGGFAPRVVSVSASIEAGGAVGEFFVSDDELFMLAEAA